MIRDGEILVRLEAVQALGNIHDPRVVEALIEALREDLFSIRYSASESLGKLTGQDFGLDYDKWKAWYEKKTYNIFTI